MKTIFSLFIFMLVSQAEAVVPKEAFTFDFNIKTVRMSRIKENKLMESADILRQIFSSPEFRAKVLRHKFKGKYRFARNKGLSNAQIYRKILEGVEKLHPYQNDAMDVEIELYNDPYSKVLGYTNPRTKRIWMNTKYFNKNSPAKIASNLTHEWLHKLGFDHEREHSSVRKYSVPYAVGYIVKELAKDYE